MTAKPGLIRLMLIGMTLRLRPYFGWSIVTWPPWAAAAFAFHRLGSGGPGFRGRAVRDGGNVLVTVVNKKDLGTNARDASVTIELQGASAPAAATRITFRPS